jgi:acyl dehydratase
MSLDHELVGVPGEPGERSWSSSDVMLYALGVGAGQGNPLEELALTTENTGGVELCPLPTFVNLLGSAGTRSPLGDFDPARLVHGEQAFTLHHPLPVAGTARSVSTVTGMYDKGAGALVVTESTVVDAPSGVPLATIRSSAFIRGEGGFGGERGPVSDWPVPTGEPDIVMRYRTRPEQALLYRLTGDRNPLHADPEFARRGGFDRPILHGMCTYGYAGRALLHAVCNSDPTRFLSMEARFTKPVFPGDDLTVSIWVDGSTAHFRVANDGATVLDRGRLTFKP